MSDLRAEARTDHGWQRFDRVAGLVSLLLVLALLILWFARTDVQDNDGAQASTSLSELAEPDDKLTKDTADAKSNLDTVAAVLPGAVSTEPTVDEKPGKLAMVESAAQKDSKKTVESTLAKNKIDISKKEIETAEKAEKAEKATASKPVTKKTEKPAPKKEVPGKTADAKKGNEAKEGEKTKKAESANTDSVAGMSLASQDPAKQATFERIPKYIEKSITAGGSLTAAGQTSSTNTELASSASTADADSTKESASDVQRSASSLVKQVPKVNSVLELSSSDGRLSIDGIVNSEQVRASILKAGLQAYGMRNLTDRLSVNEAVAPFDWAESASDLIVLIGGPESETTVRVDGQSVTLTGQVTELGDKQSRALAAQQLFGTRARVDNRLKVVPKAKPVKVAKAKKADKDPAPKPLAPAPTPATSTPKKAEPVKPAPAARQPEKPAVPVAGQDPSQLAEGGPGQVDKVVMAPRGMPEKFKRGDCPRVMTGVRVRFRSASVEISEAGRAYLDRLKRCFRSRSYIVRGYTDSRGAALNNLILSQERAQSVVDYLISIGVPANRVSAKGYGESTPVDSNRTERGRARNRRIDFRFKR